jgi:hypothetical protein
MGILQANRVILPSVGSVAAVTLQRGACVSPEVCTRSLWPSHVVAQPPFHTCLTYPTEPGVAMFVVMIRSMTPSSLSGQQ